MTMAKARSWVSTYGLTYPVGVGPTPSVWTMYGEGYIPHNVIISQGMIVLYTHYGYNIANYQAMIETELNKPPVAPTGLTVVQQLPTQIVLQWNANIERDVAGYQLTYLEQNQSAQRAVVDVGLVTTYTLANLDLYTSYSFTLEAYDHRGHYSPPSSSASGSTVGDVPDLSIAGLLLLLAGLSGFLVLPRLRLSIRTKIG